MSRGQSSIQFSQAINLEPGRAHIWPSTKTNIGFRLWNASNLEISSKSGGTTLRRPQTVYSMNWKLLDVVQMSSIYPRNGNEILRNYPEQSTPRKSKWDGPSGGCSDGAYYHARTLSHVHAWRIRNWMWYWEPGPGCMLLGPGMHGCHTSRRRAHRYLLREELNC